MTRRRVVSPPSASPVPVSVVVVAVAVVPSAEFAAEVRGHALEVRDHHLWAPFHRSVCNIKAT